ncbi:50S ribosomal protein L2 [Rickettsiales bacterium LUAb2]
MALKHYNPITPGQRGLILTDRKDLYTGKPEKSLTKGISKTGGRNNQGRITTRHIGGGHKRKYRLVDFKRNKFNINAVVERVEYDPNRTSYIALIKYDDNTLSYIIAPNELKAGDVVCSGEAVDIRIGNTLPLKNIPVGTLVHNVEMDVNKGGRIARSAGTYVQLVSKDDKRVQLKLSSGEIRTVNSNCLATIGVVSNSDHKNINYGKAGRKRWLGVRPTVRGVAMNPIDHPHGGGEGKTSGGRHPVTPWGKPTKGKRTRTNKRTEGSIIRHRYK